MFRLKKKRWLQLRHLNAARERSLATEFCKATQLERRSAAIHVSRKRGNLQLERAALNLVELCRESAHRLSAWQETHRALVGRQCHLCAEIGDVFRIGPKVVNVYQGGVLAHMESTWMRGSQAGGASIDSLAPTDSATGIGPDASPVSARLTSPGQ